MPEPTLTYAAATFTDDETLTNVTGSLSWEAGDIVVVFGATADGGTTLGTPTATGLTFSSLATAGGSSNTQIYLWSATAGSSGSGAITSTANNQINRAGIGAFVVHGSDGLGTPVTVTGSTAKTISVTRTQANSAVACLLADWNAVNDATTDPTPAGGTERTEVPGDAATWAVYLYSWGDQGATGTTSYGVTNHTGTVKMSGIAVEIKGTTGGGTDTPIAITQGTPTFTGQGMSLGFTINMPDEA